MNKLLELINKSDRTSITKNCSRAITNGSNVTYRVTDSIPVQEVIKIYSRRSKLNKLKGSKIKGYDFLLPNLKNPNLTKIKIHLIKTAVHKYIVFTDSEETKLVGVLEI